MRRLRADPCCTYGNCCQPGAFEQHVRSSGSNFTPHDSTNNFLSRCRCVAAALWLPAASAPEPARERLLPHTAQIAFTEDVLIVCFESWQHPIDALRQLVDRRDFGFGRLRGLVGRCFGPPQDSKVVNQHISRATWNSQARGWSSARNPAPCRIALTNVHPGEVFGCALIDPAGVRGTREASAS